MRVLLTTRGSSGHLLPLAPVGHACLRAGHEVLVCAQDVHAVNVERTGLPFATVGSPPDEQWMPLMAEFGRLTVDEANAVMMGEYFARLDTVAALHGLRRLVADWRPDVIVRESWEFASTLVAEEAGVPLLRVGLGLGEVERLAIELAAPALDALRAEHGLAADPAGERLGATPYVTGVPAGLEPVAPPAPVVHRLATHAGDEGPPGPDPGPPGDDPLVYVSFGSVAAAGHLPLFPALYDAVLDALADVPVRVLLTTGAEGDPARLARVPPNARVERWVPQEQVLRHAAAVVCHGGHGSTLGALAHGLPLVVVPLFSTDQWINAAAVQAAGAGIALDADRATRRVLGLPAQGLLDRLAPAVGHVLEDDGPRRAAQALAGEMRAMEPADEVIAILRSAARPAA